MGRAKGCSGCKEETWDELKDAVDETWDELKDAVDAKQGNKHALLQWSLYNIQSHHAVLTERTNYLISGLGYYPSFIIIWCKKLPLLIKQNIRKC